MENINSNSNSQQTSEQTSSCCSQASCCGPSAPIVRMHQKVGRNEPCPCGNGKKFKKCCGQ